MQPILLDCFPEEIETVLAEKKQPRFRAKQIFTWLHKGKKFAEMQNIPLSLREALAQDYIDQPTTIAQTHASQKDDTVKFLFALPDGNMVEGVLMHYHYGYTLCISTQVGCRMGCTFCASTLGGCVRNLTAGEMIGQVLCANAHLASLGRSDTVGHVVLMGCGEPLDNYDNTIRFLKLINHEQGLHISLRHISVSTCGIVPAIDRLAKEKMPITLSISLHAPYNDMRQNMMPIAKVFPIDELLAAVRRYVQETGRRVVFEYALVANVNCEEKHARDLAKCLRGLQCHVNLIPLNPVSERDLHSATKENVKRFLTVLEQNHISATVRREMGTDIAGACGQLRRNHLKDMQ